MRQCQSRGVVAGLALALACGGEPSGPSGPVAPVVLQVSASGGLALVEVRNDGGAGEFRVTTWRQVGIGSFNGAEPSVTASCRPAPRTIEPGATTQVTFLCSSAVAWATTSVRDLAAGTGWRITSCRNLSGPDCPATLRPPQNDAVLP